MRTRFLILFAVFLFIKKNSNAQSENDYKPLLKFPLVTINQTFYSNTNFDSDQNNVGAKLSEQRGAFLFPIRTKNNTIIINGLEFTNLRTEYWKSNIIENTQRNFSSIAYCLGLVKPIGNKNWKGVLFLKPTLASDFKEKLSEDDFILQSSLLAIKRINQYSEFGIGLSFNTRFGQEMFIPMFHYVRKKHNWETYTVLPIYASQFFCFNKSKIGVSYHLNGNFYNFHNTITSDRDLDKLSYTRMNIGPEFEQVLFNKISANIKTGVSVGKELKWINKAGLEELDLSPKYCYFITLSLKVLH